MIGVCCVLALTLKGVGCGSSSKRAFSPIHRRSCSRTIPLRFALRGDSAHPPLFGQPARPDRGAWALRSFPSGAPLDICAAFWYGVVGREMASR